MLPTKTLALLTILALLPMSIEAQKNTSGVTVKQDGDFIVLIPDDPGKTYLILGYPRDADPKGGSNGQLSELKGEQRLPAKLFDRLTVLEVNPVSEVVLSPAAAGWQLTENPCRPGTCKVPYPLQCPPRCPMMYLLSPRPEDVNPIPK